MDEVVVRRAQDLVAGLQRESVVDQGQALRRAVGECHLLESAAEVVRRGTLHADRQNVIRRGARRGVEAHAMLDRHERVGVELAAMTLDRVAHRLGVRNDEELREVLPVRRELVELRLHRGPVGPGAHGRRGDWRICRRSACCRAPDKRKSDGGDKVAAIQRHGRSLPR
jgi:hypothetical protein